MKNIIYSDAQGKTLISGKRLGKLLSKGDNLALNGNLGAGKTVFTKGIATGLGVKKVEYVNSPSFVLLKEHKAAKNLYHFDLYRLNDLDEIEYIGIKEYLDGDGVVVIEWAEKMKELLPKEYLEINITILKNNKRRLEFLPKGKRYVDIVSRYFKR